MAGVTALLSAGAATPRLLPAGQPPSAALPSVRQEVVDPADGEAVVWLCGRLAAGEADRYGQDEADLALLPTLTRTWMPRGQQRRLRAPGTNEKRSVSAAIDLGSGDLVWRTDDRRNAGQFCALVQACVERSMARGRLAVLLADNAPSHRVGKTGIVRRALDRLGGRVVLVFLPAYSPHLQPVERLWRTWRPNVTHNHTREAMADLQADSDAWLGTMAAMPDAVLRTIGIRTMIQPQSRAA